MRAIQLWFTTRLTIITALLVVGVAFSQSRLDQYGDPLPPGAIMRLGTVRHRVPIAGKIVTGLPNGNLLLHVDSELWWMDETSGRVLDSWTLPEGYQFVGLSPDRKLTVIANDHSIQLWDLTVRKLIETLSSEKELPVYSGTTVHF